METLFRISFGVTNLPDVELSFLFTLFPNSPSKHKIVVFWFEKAINSNSSCVTQEGWFHHSMSHVTKTGALKESELHLNMRANYSKLKVFVRQKNRNESYLIGYIFGTSI